MPSGEVKCSGCGRVHATYEEADDGDTKFQVNEPGMRMRRVDEIPNGYEIRCPACGHVDVVYFPFDTTSITPWEE